MLYLKVLWNHKYPDQPTVIYSEIDSDGWEVRKVELFQDGRSTFADQYVSPASLSDKRVELQKIRPTAHLSFIEITVQEFNEAWDRAQRNGL